MPNTAMPTALTKPYDPKKRREGSQGPDLLSTEQRESSYRTSEDSRNPDDTEFAPGILGARATTRVSNPEVPEGHASKRSSFLCPVCNMGSGPVKRQYLKRQYKRYTSPARKARKAPEFSEHVRENHLDLFRLLNSDEFMCTFCQCDVVTSNNGDCAGRYQDWQSLLNHLEAIHAQGFPVEMYNHRCKPISIGLYASVRDLAWPNSLSQRINPEFGTEGEEPALGPAIERLSADPKITHDAGVLINPNNEAEMDITAMENKDSSNVPERTSEESGCFSTSMTLDQDHVDLYDGPNPSSSPMIEERIDSKAIEGEEQMQQHQRLDLQEQERDPMYYDPRGNGSLIYNSQVPLPSRHTLSSSQRPQPSRSDRSDLPRARQVRLPSVPFRRPIGEYFTDDDAFSPRSPGLTAVKVKAKLEEEPPPIVTQIFVSPPTSRNRKKSKRRKHRPTQGDWVLIREMDPNRPDIAHAASQEALNSASETESSDEEMQGTPREAKMAATSGNLTLDDDSISKASDEGIKDQPSEVQTPAPSFNISFDDDGVSNASSYAASITTSVESLESDATSLSQHTGYSPYQIATATKVLISIFQEDESLIPLYKCAIDDASIGEERLQRNLYRLLKSYALDLGEEYQDRLEFLASKLVAVRAKLLAKSIVDNFRPQETQQIQPYKPQVQRSAEDVSDEEPEFSSVDDKDFEDLRLFREFLTESTAIVMLRSRLQSFVSPKSGLPMQDSQDGAEKGPEYPRATEPPNLTIRTWKRWRSNLAGTLDALLIDKDASLAWSLLTQLPSDAFVLATDRLFIAMRLLEPPLTPDLIRLRWICGCGDRLFSDVQELQEGGVLELASRMQESTGAKVICTAYSKHSANQQYTGSHHLRWFRNGTSGSHPTQQQTIPLSSATTASLASAVSSSVNTANQNTPPNDTLLYLMACVHDKGSDKVLLQDRIQGVSTDRALVQFLREQYKRHRSWLRSAISLKRVQGIFFVRFHLPLGDSVIILPHETACVPAVNTPGTQGGSQSCECLPPRNRVEPDDTAEYKCRPVPPKVFPPIPPEYLLAFFTCRKEPHELSTWMVEQFPKRKRGTLFGSSDQPAEGWGIYYKEGWNPKMIARFILGLLLASLVFGIVWTQVKSDIQGAFGVASWIVGVGGALLAVIVTSANSV